MQNEMSSPGDKGEGEGVGKSSWEKVTFEIRQNLKVWGEERKRRC